MENNFIPVVLAKDSLYFPDPKQGDAQGLLAIGGDLSAQRLLAAYRQGIFPWFQSGTPILWWSPDPRLILSPYHFKISHSLKKTLKRAYRFTMDTAFAEVIAACATVNDRTAKTWITSQMLRAYTELHHLGYAHSCEIWDEEQLIGGLYGVSLGRAFFGESMFHRRQDASKLALYHLCQKLLAWEFDFIDCQLPTEHLQSLGAIAISRREFLDKLEQSLQFPTKQGKWSTE